MGAGVMFGNRKRRRTTLLSLEYVGISYLKYPFVMPPLKDRQLRLTEGDVVVA